VVGDLVGADHPVCHVDPAALLDPSARTLAGGVGVQQEGRHERGIERRRAPAVGPVVGPDRVEVKLVDDIEDEPGEVVARQPVADRDRHQVLLITLDRPEVVAHALSLLPAPTRES
jgi:hypothetical protein